MSRKNLCLLLVTTALFSGCSFSIGNQYSKSEEDGYDYADTGVVADPYFLFKHRKEIKQSAIYPNAACRDGHKEKSLLGSD